MLKVFGKNNNNLIKKSSKQTFSMPQSIRNAPVPIRKCACGYDFLALIGSDGLKRNVLIFMYQGSFYPIENIGPIFDVAVSQSTIAVITINGNLMVWQFDEEKVKNRSVSANKIMISLEQGDSLTGVTIGGNDIFLSSEEGKVYHFKKNQWYETKTYSNIEQLELSVKIVEISSGPKINLFLTYGGQIFSSSKQDPLNLIQIESKQHFIKISTYNYCAAISKKGTIFIWGQSIHGRHAKPIQFAKLTKKFIQIWLQKDNGFALSDDGQIWGWGANKNGQLGLSDYQQRLKPFPLVTLQKNRILDLFCGQSYTVCLCQPEYNQDNTFNVVSRKVSGFEIHRQQSKQSLASFMNNQEIFIDENSFQIRSPNAVRKNNNGNFDKKTPSRSKSRQNNKHAKAQKSPRILSSISNKGQKQKNISITKTNCHKKKVSKPKQNNLLTWREIGINTIDKYDEHESKCNISSINRSGEIDTVVQSQDIEFFKANNISLQEENQKLKEKINQQHFVIEDITGKIRLLQQAIDEYERNLTQRDQMVENQQEKEKEYLNHINQLQSSLDEMIKTKEKNQQITVVYESLEKDFEKQRHYYTNKIKEQQADYHHSCIKYQQEIEQLKIKIKQIDKENSDNIGRLSKQTRQTSHTKLRQIANVPLENTRQKKVNEIEQIPTFKFAQKGEQIYKNYQTNYHLSGNHVTPEHTDRQMEEMISKIQSSKSRIKNSANKLYAVLDLSY